MAAKRAERLVNLVIALLSTRQYVTAAQIRATVPGYEADDGSETADEAFKRMFERDKAELREMGVPLETGRDQRLRHRGRLPHRARRLRAARDPADRRGGRRRRPGAAAVGVRPAGRRRAQRPGQAQGGRRRRRRSRAIPLQPRLDAGEPAFEPCYAAARDRRALEFDYQRPDEDVPARRRVQPWGVVAWHGRWYLVGLDLDRGAARVFRLSRVVGTPKASGPAGAFEPPADVDLADVVAGQVGGEEHAGRGPRPAGHAPSGCAGTRHPLGPARTTATTG